jgi:hypothetical protein
MLRDLVSASAAALLSAGFASAQSSAYQLELDQPSYAPTEVITLTVTGQPGVPGVVLIDPVPGPVDILGLTLDVGLSDKLTFVGVPPLGSNGQFVLPCTAPCELVEIDLYAQAVSVDPATLELFTSNAVTITSPEEYGFCGPCEECKGGVVAMTLRYLGTDEVFVEVYEEGHYQHDHDQYFAGLVGPKGVFSFIGEGNDNKLAKDTAIAINGVEVTSFHTSCSQPIAPGLQFGPFLALEVSSKDNGPACPIDSNACNECEGGVTAMTLEFQGSDEVFVEVYEEGHYQHDHDQYFAGFVSPGESFSFIGDGDDNKLAKDTAIAVNGIEVLDFHTSCSQPIGPGLLLGEFLVTAAESKDNGKICPLEDPGDPNALDDCEAGKPVALGLTYTGEGCSASNNSQDPDKATCAGGAGFAEFVHIVVFEDDDAVYFDGLVQLGDEFFALASNAGEDKFKANTRVEIFGTDGALLEELLFHTSCSQPLAVGDTFGSLTLTTFVPED